MCLRRHFYTQQHKTPINADYATSENGIGIFLESVNSLAIYLTVIYESTPYEFTYKYLTPDPGM